MGGVTEKGQEYEYLRCVSYNYTVVKLRGEGSAVVIVR